MVRTEAAPLPPLAITCFRGFEVRRSGTKVELCHNRHGQMILRYLTAHPRHRETIDTLIEVLWPDDPEIPRRRLYVALSALRCSLNSGYASQSGAGYVLCDGGVYQLNPAIPIHIDAEEFAALYRAGQQVSGDAAISHFEEACRLYRGPFLPEDLYADWSLIQREHLTQIHLTICHTLWGAGTWIAVDPGAGDRASRPVADVFDWYADSKHTNGEAP
jgi:DNA-binding SARP family transcriptional activator